MSGPDGRRRAGGDGPFESIVGYSRAVRVGAVVAVSGTTGVDERGRVVAPGDAGAQAARALEIIAGALDAVGGRMEDVVRTRVYVTDISRWEEVASAHAAALGHVRPACTMVEVARLIDPEMLVEIEADAVVVGP